MFSGKQRGKIGIKPDPLASLFLEAVFDGGGAPTLTGQYAIHWMCSHLRRNDLLPFLDCAYPFIGENEDGNEVNLINPGTNNLNFQLSFNHTNGCKAPASGNSYAQTGYVIPAGNQNNLHICAYLTEPETATNGVPIGVTQRVSGTITRIANIIARNASLFPSAVINATSSGQVIGNVTSRAGVLLAQRASSTVQQLHVNGTKFTATTSSITPSAGEIYLFARHEYLTTPSNVLQSRARQGWASIGTAMSDAQVGVYTTLLTSYNNILARQWRG
jgi:hypothetical protein